MNMLATQPISPLIKSQMRRFTSLSPDVPEVR